jgi:hypothetical protein
LIADPKKVFAWKEKLDQLGEGLKIGLCWSSGVSEKIRKHQLNSTSNISHFYPLLNIQDVTIISLQYTDVTEELKIVKEETGKDILVLDDIDMKNDQDSLAALMVALDLTISVHTAVQQMAAAINGANIWVIPANNTPFHRLMKTPTPNDIDDKRRDLEELLSMNVEAAVSILTEATKKNDPSKWITEISNQEAEDGRLYPTAT